VRALKYYKTKNHRINRKKIAIIRALSKRKSLKRKDTYQATVQ
jgi:hypothetical protein